MSKENKGIAMHWQVIIGLLLGIVYAWMSIQFGWNEFTLNWIQPFGDIFINLLKLIAVPLVLFSIISGVASLGDMRKLGRMGIKTLALYLTTTMFAVIVGLTLVNVFKPGDHASETLREANRIRYELWRDANDIVRLDEINFTQNPELAEMVATIKSESIEHNEWVNDKLTKADKTKTSGPLQPLVDVVPKNIFQSLSDMQMLQIIFFAIFFGVVVTGLKDEQKGTIVRAVGALNEVFVQMVWVVMKIMPLFVFALMAGQIVKAAGTDPANFQQLLTFLLRYSLVVVLGLAIMAFLIYPLIITLFVKKMTWKQFTSGMRDAQITAFSTSSSVATLPVTMKCVEENLKVSERTASFVLPIGATVNMDGTSLYQAIAVVALAQFHMIDLTMAQQAIIVLTATLASIGAAAIPSAGLVLMIIVLESVGLNPAWIALIFPVDRILDMCRTVVNVTGDGTVSTLVAASEGEIGNALETES
ncbi:MAG: dicarboxylate/amino acid:cation symporter [Bacteroidetes bacterium]|jgi:Na+/H+-dicarboxylate symporter|nr:dicarboxylate/amino acid:cation symporter [Bacteroidota bacterium]MDA0980593.1 dicarboxylate/amino acid:cation symporter [Bacteroidota bacterium]